MEEIESEMRPMIRYILNNYDLSIPLTGLEIGVKGGTNDVSILKTLPIKMLYMIDPFLPYEERDNLKMRQFFMEFKRDVLNIYPNNTILIKKKSIDAVNDIPDNLDFVYIDGDHYAINSDISLYYDKVKPGGVFGGHDYDSTQYTGIKAAVDEFVNKNGLTLNYKYSEFPSKSKAATDWWVVK